MDRQLIFGSGYLNGKECGFKNIEPAVVKHCGGKHHGFLILEENANRSPSERDYRSV
jgi:hypothetical protein